MRSRARRKHSIKRVDRLLSSALAHMDMPGVLAAMIHRAVGRVRRPTVLIDWTGLGSGMAALVAAVPVRGRAIPILFEVSPESRLGNRRIQHRFLLRLRDLLPADCTPIVVADAGFQAPFYSFVDQLGWGFVVRVRGGKRRFYGRRVTMPDLLVVHCPSLWISTTGLWWVPASLRAWSSVLQQRHAGAAIHTECPRTGIVEALPSRGC